MEEEKYGDKAVRATSMLLLQLQAAMILDRSKKISYSVYIDDAGTYMPYIKNLLKYGDFYGFMTTLFFKSREELGEDVILLDSFVRNFILLQGINYEDAKYFAERMNIKGNGDESGAQALMNREYGSVIVEYIEGKTFKRKIEEGSLIEFSEEKKKEFAAKGNQFKKKYREVDAGEHHYQLIESAALLEQEEKNGGTFLENIKDDVKESIDFDDNTEETENASSLFVLDDPEDPVMPEEDTPVKVDIPNKMEYKMDNQGGQTKGKEPQLNQKIKPVNIKTEKRTDFSLLDEFDFGNNVEKEVEVDPVEADMQNFNLDVPDNLDEIDYSDADFSLDFDDSDIPEPQPSFDLNEEVKIPEVDEKADDTTFSIGGSKNRPYKKINNPKIEKSLQGFKI